MNKKKYLELQSSVRKHQFSQIRLQLSKNTGHFAARKHETLGNFISGYMVYRRRQLLANRSDKGNPLILKHQHSQTANKLYGYYRLEAQKKNKYVRRKLLTLRNRAIVREIKKRWRRLFEEGYGGFRFLCS